MFELIQKFTGALFIVIPLIWLVLYFYSKSAGATRAKDKTELMNVVTTLPLGPKKMVSVVNIAGKYLVLGVGPESINYLTSIDDAKALERIKQSVAQGAPGKLRKVLNFQKSTAALNFTKLLKVGKK